MPSSESASPAEVVEAIEEESGTEISDGFWAGLAIGSVAMLSVGVVAVARSGRLPYLVRRPFTAPQMCHCSLRFSC